MSQTSGPFQPNTGAGAALKEPLCPPEVSERIDQILPWLALGSVLSGQVLGLFWAPPDRMMGEVYRIMFVHVPAAWLTLVAYTVTLVASLVVLARQNMKADALAEASAEVGVVFNAVLLVTGSIWGKPTWGVWWSWDPRLTTAAIMFGLFAGYLALRRAIDAPDRRSVWSALVAVLIFADIPIVWFSVKWFNSLHQLQSSPQTVAAPMVTALRTNALAFLAVYLCFLRWRYKLARHSQTAELPPWEVLS